ncbi:hypothetical protein JCM10213_008902 [Rhodosporidiobolus nylandii]
MGSRQSVELYLRCGDEQTTIVVQKAAVEQQTFTWTTIYDAANEHFGVEKEDIYGFAYAYEPEGHYFQKKLLKGAPLNAFLKHLDGVAARRHAPPSLAPSSGPPKDQLVDLKVGVPPEFDVLSFHMADPPSLVDVLRAASCSLDDTHAAASAQLFLVEENGELVRLKSEKDWARIGWPRAKQVFLAGQQEGGWKAATFQLHGASSNLPTYSAAPNAPTSEPMDD